MGKSPKPLSFLIHPEIHDAEPELWEKLRGQGHTVKVMDYDAGPAGEHGWLQGYDLILGRNCWRLFDCDGLNLAIQSARRVKFGKPEKKEKKPRKPRKKKEVEE